MKKHSIRLAAAAATSLALLSACGGGGGGDAPAATPAPPVGVTPTPTPPVVPTPSPAPDPTPSTPVGPPVIDPNNPPDWLALANRCEHPLPGSSDRQGSLMDELKWLRSFYSETYLWYRELPANPRLENYTRAVDFFADYKTFATTASGRAKDRFHFTYPTEVWEGLSSSGTEVGYGVTWARNADPAAPRVWAVAMVSPASPGALAGLQRGDGLLSVDGVALTDTTSDGVARLNAGLFPATAGETHSLVLTRAGVPLTVNLASRQVSNPPVQNVKTIDTPTGKVGYLQFDDHNQLSESELAKAIGTFKAANIVDLVLDMRYNGGGYLAVANELAYMIAGPAATSGKIFEQLQYNDKTTPQPPDMFRTKAYGFKSSQLAAGAALPYLGLKRVTILTTPGTCSASESVINGLRGIDVEVNLIGGETCGKPYGFVPANNCGTTYFAIQLQGANHKGFGDYADGFQPTCRADDDFDHVLGDSAERLLSTALSYRASGACPAQPAMNRARSATATIGSGAMTLVRPQAREIAIRNR
ncbi:S41 family peptidase [Oxalobacteraceae bacterium OTU3CINTB1]|nr:S41 family peptidase [Oxalobacteraceae bacterium OTU3CINTB1]